MTESSRKNLADILVNYCVRVKKNDWVAVVGNIISEPLINDIQEKILLAGGNPSVMFTSDQLNETRLKFSNETQLSWISPFVQAAFEKTDSVITVWSAENTRTMSNVSAEKLNIEQNAERGLREIFSKRMAEGKAKWVGTQYPCHSYAQEAEMSLREYQEFVYSATFANQPDPIAAWERVHEKQQKYVDFLKGKKTIYVRGDHADLHLSIEGRRFINEGGEENMPGGEVFTSPVEDSANGWIEFTYPAIMHGHEVQGIHLEFKDGKVIKASAEKNEDFLLKTLDVDENARFLGEFAIGTNYGIQRFTKNLLFDEKIGGTIHLALGEGFEDAGGKNMSSIHWDMICDMHHGEILADGEIFYKDGNFIE